MIKISYIFEIPDVKMLFYLVLDSKNYLEIE